MFTFGFSKEENAEDDEKVEELQWLEAEEIKCSDKVKISNEIKTFQCLNHTITHLDVNNVIEKLKESGCDAVTAAESLHSDLIPANYEGGFKIWECTKDLLEYLIGERQDFHDKLVLDLGCGLGLLGIFAITQGANVHFQDYNSEVINHITIPNVQLNCSKTEDGEDKLSKVRYFSGDWASFNALTSEESKYDFILTSETIYNGNNYKKLHNLFRNRLANDGVIYLAAKTYYFGVGGGLRQFEDLLKSENIFNFQTVWKCTEGVKREILKIYFR